MWPETQKKADLELSMLRRLLSGHSALLDDVREREPDDTQLLALAALLHSFYTGIENIFKRIATEIDASVPAGVRWHSDLLLQMEHEGNLRAPVITEELRRTLGEYMDFRHVFCHAYSFDLKWRKMSGLVLQVRNVFERLETELCLFFKEE